MLDCCNIGSTCILLPARRSQKLGGETVTAKDKYSFQTEILKIQADFLLFAAVLEKGAVGAYLGAVPIFRISDLAKAAANILGDEATHRADLRNALGEVPVPAAFIA